jgi:hypothetical protein
LRTGIIQCHLHPAIPWQVAPQQSLPPFHRATGILTQDMMTKESSGIHGSGFFQLR